MICREKMKINYIKMKFTNIHNYAATIQLVALYPTVPFYNIIIKFYNVLRQKGNIEHEK